MQQQTSATRAAIDIGSNTIEVLIARCLPDNLEIIEHQSTLARLGEGVDEKGEISRDKFKAALDAVGKYQKLAKKHGAEEILAFAMVNSGWRRSTALHQNWEHLCLIRVLT